MGLAVALVLRAGRRAADVLTAALLIVGAAATVDPLMNHWYFIAVRPAEQRGGVMPVPGGHRTYESDDLTGLATGAYLERMTNLALGPGGTARFTGPAAIVVLDGEASVTMDHRSPNLSAQQGATVAGGVEATVRARSAGARVLVTQVLPASSA